MEVLFDPKKGLWVEGPEEIEKLRKSDFGRLEKGKIWLEIEEALYLINLQRFYCRMGGKELDFNQLASYYMDKVPGLFIRYNAYRDWRDRGLVIRRLEKFKAEEGVKSYKRYPSSPLRIGKLKLEALWYPESFFSAVRGTKELFEKYWFGQFGVYKQERGDLLKLNFFETVFLAKHFGLKVKDSKGKALSHTRILAQVTKKREWTKQLYEVYEDWRLKGFVVKTGFKFGSHFRIYFPGGSPVGEYKHSKHVLHVFPAEQKMLISEWARAVRVAHGVKKTFLLAIPKKKVKVEREYMGDFLAYRRKKTKEGWVRETVKDGPRYLLVTVSEDEHIGGVELAALLEKAKRMGLELILSISDRETAITYYILKKVVLPGSRQEYYEIEWLKP